MSKYESVKKNCNRLLSFSEEKRNLVLNEISKVIKESTSKIIHANNLDIKKAKELNLSNAILDRLLLNESRIQSLCNACSEIAAQKQVVGIFEGELKRENGLNVKLHRIPLGLLAMIFESRPNVVVDAMSLAIKSANGLVLKGGKEAKHSNAILFDIIQKVFIKYFQLDVFLLLEDRDEVKELLLEKNNIDLVIARGGSSLVDFVKKNATMPVMAHDKGLCHLYVHSDAKQDWVNKIVLDAKLSRPGVCNALETLLLHETYPHVSDVLNLLLENKVQIKGCIKTCKIIPHAILANEQDYSTEYLDKIINVKIVKSFEDAFEHIHLFGSHHTESILAQDETVINRFILEVDASCLVVNSSTRFNDGGELGLGAELGISTSKFHSYGPVGAEHLTTTRYVVFGSGQTRHK